MRHIHHFLENHLVSFFLLFLARRMPDRFLRLLPPHIHSYEQVHFWPTVRRAHFFSHLPAVRRLYYCMHVCVVWMCGVQKNFFLPLRQRSVPKWGACMLWRQPDIKKRKNQQKHSRKTQASFTFWTAPISQTVFDWLRRFSTPPLWCWERSLRFSQCVSAGKSRGSFDRASSRKITLTGFIIIKFSPPSLVSLWHHGYRLGCKIKVGGWAGVRFMKSRKCFFSLSLSFSLAGREVAGHGIAGWAGVRQMAHNELSLSSLCSLLLLSFFFFLWPTLWILSLFPGLTEWVWPEFCLVEKMMVVKPLTVRLTDWQLAWPPANWTRNTTIDLLKESMPKSFCCYSSPNFDLFKEK